MLKNEKRGNQSRRKVKLGQGKGSRGSGLWGSEE